MNWDLILTVLGVGLVLLVLTPFYLVLVIAYQKARASIAKELFERIGKDQSEEDAWATIFEMKGDK